MNTNTQGYGLTPFPAVTGIKAITKPDIATQIMNAFGTLETTLKNISPIGGNEVQLAEAWGNLSAIRAEFIDLCSGTHKVGHA
jgi:hypothetical protein